ncbi:MFS transporter [Methylophilus sp. OH31]|uniref:MFS transporter n=1 Tax=Methylophilus sp. OH31 TaxID=1387312 RepID=UPI000467BE45|nr:MFS transporter [Methylophilus sp. OH31]
MATSHPPLQPVPLNAQQEKHLLFTLAGIQFSHILDFMIMMPIGPILMQALHIHPTQFALLLSIYTLTAAASGLIAATFIDQFERKGMLLVLFTLFVLATLACAWAPDYLTLLLTRGLAGVFGGVLGAMLQTLVGDLIPFERRGKASGIVMSGTAAATVLGVPTSLLLANHIGWQAPFIAIAAVASLFLLLALRHIPSLSTPQRTQRGWQQAANNMKNVLANANHLTGLLFMAVGAFSTFTVIPYLTLFLTGNVGLDMAQMPVVYILGGLASFCSARWIGGIADRYGKVRTYRLIAAFSMLPILLQTHLTTVAFGWVLLCTTLFFTVGTGRSIPAMAITLSAIHPPLRGTFMSLNAAIQQLACGAAALVGGWVITQSADGSISGYGHAGWLAVVLTGFTILLAGRIQMLSAPVPGGAKPATA